MKKIAIVGLLLLSVASLGSAFNLGGQNQGEKKQSENIDISELLKQAGQIPGVGQYLSQLAPIINAFANSNLMQGMGTG